MAGENHFQLFGLPERYALDSSALEQTWRALAARVHPDRYATASAVERRVAMEWASNINEAYRVLKSPLERARYLCELSGCGLQAETNTSVDSDFLMLQIMLHEQLDEAREQGRPDLLQALGDEIGQARQTLMQTVAELIDGQRNFEQASKKVREWMFVEKLSQEVQAALNDHLN